MGRLVAAALVIVAAGIGVVIANGPGKDKPAEVAKGTPKRESTRVELSLTGGREGKAGRPQTGGATVGATVKMKDLRFRPAVVHVRVGQAVQWVNRDDVAHTVFEDVGARSGEEPAFSSNRIQPGDGFTYVFRTAGTIRFVCTLHPGIMHGTVVVDNAS